MLVLFNNIAEECTAWLRGAIAVKQPSEETKAELATVKTQYRLAMMVVELPKVIAEAQRQIEAKAAQMERARKAAVDTGASEVGGGIQ